MGSKNNQKAIKKNWFPKYIKWLWGLFILGIVGVAMIFLLASWEVFGEMPTFEHLENPQTNLATEILSSDNVTLGKFYVEDNRTPVYFKDLPKHLVDALVATEDERYFEHSGIDFRGTARAFVYLGKKGGASTITQQLARQLFVGVRIKDRLEAIKQKSMEWVIATRLERQYTKEEIIAMYLNIYDFGYSGDGIRSASRIYFGKEPIDLKIEESAVLIGMLKNSSLFDPLKREEKVKNRRNTVLAQMYRNDYLTKKEKDSLQALPMKINYNPENHKEGLATYFRMYLQRYLKEWTKNNPKPNGEKYNLYLDGLKVHTTIDSRMQYNAEEAVSAHMTKLQKEFFAQNTPERNKTAPFLDLKPEQIDAIMERAIKTSARWHKMKDAGYKEKEIRASFRKATKMRVFTYETESRQKDTTMTPLDSIRYYKHFLRTAIMSMEPQTGHVKAWVGGVDYRYFQYDQVIQGARQAGSTFKPFVYAAAIDQLRLSPCDSFPDIRTCIEAEKYGNIDVWCPKNSNGKYSEKMLTLKEALANSVNSVTAKLMDEIGPVPVIQIAKNLGIKKNIEELPSIALGTPDMTVMEMVAAYGTFANKGVYVEPVLVTRIEDKNGIVLFEYTPKTKDVLSEEVAYAMVDLMKGVTASGSGARLRTKGAEKYNKVYQKIMTGYPYEFKNPIAGKTGTTQNQSDGWFMGMVPNLVSGVWVGGEDRATRFRRTAYGQGASMALPIWGMYMKANYQNEELEVSRKDFEKPKDLGIEVDCKKYKAKVTETEENPLEENLEDFDEF